MFCYLDFEAKIGVSRIHQSIQSYTRNILFRFGWQAVIVVVDYADLARVDLSDRHLVVWLRQGKTETIKTANYI